MKLRFHVFKLNRWCILPTMPPYPSFHLWSGADAQVINHRNHTRGKTLGTRRALVHQSDWRTAHCNQFLRQMRQNAGAVDLSFLSGLKAWKVG